MSVLCGLVWRAGLGRVWGCCRDAMVGGGEEVDVLSILGWAGEGVCVWGWGGGVGCGSGG